MIDEVLLFNIINTERQKKGVEPLILDTRLMQSAANKCMDLSDKGSLGDLSVDAGSAAYIRKQTGGDYRNLGSISTIGYELDSVLRSFVKNSGSKEYIFDPKFTHAGVGTSIYEGRIMFITLHLAG